MVKEVVLRYFDRLHAVRAIIMCVVSTYGFLVVGMRGGWDLPLLSVQGVFLANELLKALRMELKFCAEPKARVDLLLSRLWTCHAFATVTATVTYRILVN